MQKFFILILILFSLSACIRKISIEQGNVFTPDMVSQVHQGMSQSDVENILGTPQLLNTFDDHRVIYVYTFKPGRGKTTEKQFILTFDNGQLTNIHKVGI